MLQFGIIQLEGVLLLKVAEVGGMVLENFVIFQTKISIAEILGPKLNKNVMDKIPHLNFEFILKFLSIGFCTCRTLQSENSWQGIQYPTMTSRDR